MGDGASDIPMFEAVYGIAMGNSEDSVKAKADFIAESITDDGFYKACLLYTSMAAQCVKSCEECTQND